MRSKTSHTISPKLFIAALENIFSRIKWENVSVDVDERKIKRLRFADDIILFAQNVQQM